MESSSFPRYIWLWLLGHRIERTTTNNSFSLLGNVIASFTDERISELLIYRDEADGKGVSF